jgi:hypothetical protein
MTQQFGQTTPPSDATESATPKEHFHHRFGALLTNRGLTPEQIATATRINARFVEALRDGRFETLPSHVIGRGFLRTIGREYRLPANELNALVDAYNAANPAAERIPSLNIRHSRGLDAGPPQIAQNLSPVERALTSLKERTARPLWENVKAVRVSTFQPMASQCQRLARRLAKPTAIGLAATLVVGILAVGTKSAITRIKLARANAAEKLRVEALERQAKIAEEARLAAEAAQATATLAPTAASETVSAAPLPTAQPEAPKPVATVAAAPQPTSQPMAATLTKTSAGSLSIVVPTNYTTPVIPLVLAPLALEQKTSDLKAQAATTSSPKPSKPAMARAPQMIELIVKKPVQATFQFDGGTRFTTTLQPEHFRYGFQHKADLSVSNAASVQILFNGIPVQSDAPQGQPAKLSFSAPSEKPQKL